MLVRCLGAATQNESNGSFSPRLKCLQVGDMGDKFGWCICHDKCMLKENFESLGPNRDLGRFFCAMTNMDRMLCVMFVCIFLLPLLLETITMASLSVFMRMLLFPESSPH